MHFELVMVGAHDGRKQRDLILRAAAHGRVLLIEPVPFLFDALLQNYQGVANVACRRCCVTETPGPVRFYAPTADAVHVYPFGDQLGSMDRGHAVAHAPGLAACIQEIEAEGVTFRDLVRQYGITSLNALLTDTEGFDAVLLPQFPFDRLRPGQIFFEFKHADGPFRIGRRFGALLILLDALGYDVRVLDLENCLAIRRPQPA